MGRSMAKDGWKGYLRGCGRVLRVGRSLGNTGGDVMVELTVVQSGDDEKKLADMLQRVENLLSEQLALAEDMAQLLKEAKKAGLNPAVLKRAARFALDESARDKYEKEHKTLLDYMGIGS